MDDHAQSSDGSERLLDDGPDQNVSGLPRSLFDGVEAAVCNRLKIDRLRHRSALHALGRSDVIPTGSVAAVLDQIAINWQACAAKERRTSSKQNWRWAAPVSALGSANRSPEVILERAIISACVAAGRGDWTNQVPVASGVVRPSAERRRAIDLAHQVEEGHFEFVELKIASDTPLYAAFEIISYIGVWLLSRVQEPSSTLLLAERVDARVLAPEAFYAPFKLGPLGHQLNEELAAYGARHRVRLSFAFEALPAEFTPKLVYEPAEVLTLIDHRRRL